LFRGGGKIFASRLASPVCSDSMRSLSRSMGCRDRRHATS
jgi:hypothetical protein